MEPIVSKEEFDGGKISDETANLKASVNALKNKISHFENIVMVKDDKIQKLKVKNMELVAALSELDISYTEESDSESYFDSQSRFDDIEHTQTDSFSIDQCSKVLKTSNGVSVHIGRVHNRKERRKFQ